MEDILASIKRIIAEDEGAGVRPAAMPPATATEVLELTQPIAPARPTAAAADHDGAPDPVIEEAIVSPETRDALRGALGQLDRAVAPTPVVAAGGQTIDALVREMLRPLLREWLDTHLPPLVEALVAREIARIAAR